MGLVDILANGSAMAIQFKRLGQDLGVKDGQPMILFLTGVKNILREMPEKIYPDRSTRISMLEAVQDALDSAIDLDEGNDAPDQVSH